MLTIPVTVDFGSKLIYCAKVAQSNMFIYEHIYTSSTLHIAQTTIDCIRSFTGLIFRLGFCRDNVLSSASFKERLRFFIEATPERSRDHRLAHWLILFV